jgi:Glycosyl hydrolase family 79, N-terminal domain
MAERPFVSRYPLNGLAVLLGVAVTVGVIGVSAQPAARASATAGLSHSRVIATVSPRYVSFAVDLDQVVGGMFWSQTPGSTAKTHVAPYDFERSRLIKLTRALSPAYLRISGTAANETYYDLSEVTEGVAPPGYHRVLTRSEWDTTNSFADRLGLTIFLGINAGPGPRDTAGEWSPNNARELLEYTTSMHYPLGAVEFGNEPNLLSDVSGVPTSYSATDYVRDLGRFKTVRDASAPQALLVGPGSFNENAGNEYFGSPLGPLSSEILPSGGDLYDVLTWHAYAARSTRCPVGGGGPVPAEPLAPEYLDGLISSYSKLKELGQSYSPGRPLWYGEGASASCGGQPGYSNRWEATFWYLNALGALAERGVQVFVRQTLSGSDYGLIDEATMLPNPDYWAALMWHRFMGTRILRPQTRNLPSRVRVFGACTPTRRGGTLLALNIDPRHPHALILDGGRRRREIYLATSTDLLGQVVLLNGRALEPGVNGDLPRLRPHVTRSASIILPPASYAFVLEPHAGPRACGAGARSAEG